jgi:hypothetical protein
LEPLTRLGIRLSRGCVDCPVVRLRPCLIATWSERPFLAPRGPAGTVLSRAFIKSLYPLRPTWLPYSCHFHSFPGISITPNRSRLGLFWHLRHSGNGRPRHGAGGESDDRRATLHASGGRRHSAHEPAVGSEADTPWIAPRRALRPCLESPSFGTPGVHGEADLDGSQPIPGSPAVAVYQGLQGLTLGPSAGCLCRKRETPLEVAHGRHRRARRGFRGVTAG